MESFADPSIWKEDVFMLPVLGLYADYPRSDLDYMKKRFPRLEFFKIPGTGHFLMLEKPQEFNRLLKSFLDRQKY
jgi:pimeloyl-ACP methyl ester carboxylesterase